MPDYLAVCYEGMAALDAAYEDVKAWSENMAGKRAGGSMQTVQEVLVKLKRGMDLCREVQQFIVGRLYEREDIKGIVAEEVGKILATSGVVPSEMVKGKSSYAAVASNVPVLNMTSKKKIATPKKGNVVLVFAPGEDRTPLPILTDNDAESMSFIKIYGGTLRQIPSHMSYQDWVNSEITRTDRRCTDVPKLFFSSSKLRVQKISSSVMFCPRQTKGKPIVTAGMLLDPNCVQQIIHHDGFKVFAKDRGSPAFWEEKKK